MGTAYEQQTLVSLVSLRFPSPGVEASMNKRDRQRTEGPATGESILPNAQRSIAVHTSSPPSRRPPD